MPSQLSTPIDRCRPWPQAAPMPAFMRQARWCISTAAVRFQPAAGLRLSTDAYPPRSASEKRLNAHCAGTPATQRATGATATPSTTAGGRTFFWLPGAGIDTRPAWMSKRWERRFTVCWDIMISRPSNVLAADDPTRARRFRTSPSSVMETLLISRSRPAVFSMEWCVC